MPLPALHTVCLRLLKVLLCRLATNVLSPFVRHRSCAFSRTERCHLCLEPVRCRGADWSASVLTCRRGPTGPSGFYCSGKLAPPVSLGTPSHPVAAMPRHAAPCQRHATPCSLSTAQSATYLPDNVLRLAVLIPTRASSPGKRASIGAVALAAAAVNDPAASVLSGKKLEYVVTSVRCDSSDATAAVSRMLEQGPVNAVIGPDCSAACESSAFLTAGRNIAQISYSCLSAVLSDKEKYPTVHSLLPTVRTAQPCHNPLLLVCPRTAQRNASFPRLARSLEWRCAGLY